MAGVSTTNRSNSADADGVATVFNFTFFVYSASHIKVYSVLDDALTPITTGITKVINSSFIGGSVTFAVAPADAVGEILVRREVPYTQETEFSDITRYKESAIEEALNTIVLQVQQLAEESARTLKYTEAAAVTDATIETPVDDAVAVFDGLTGRLRAGATIATIEAAGAEAAAAAASAAAALVSEGNADVSEAAAAASAAAAAASAASGLYANILPLTFANSPFVPPQSAEGTLYRCDCTGGNIVINLSALSVYGEDTKFAFVKVDGGANTITVNRGGSDTINGATSLPIATQYETHAILGDFTTAAWIDIVQSTGIPDNAVTNAKLADMAQATFKMRAAGTGTGDPIDGTAAQALSALGVVARVKDTTRTPTGISELFAIPANATRITLISTAALSTNGTSGFAVRGVVSGTPKTTGYSGINSFTQNIAPLAGQSSQTNGMGGANASVAAQTYFIKTVLDLIDAATFTWGYVTEVASVSAADFTAKCQGSVSFSAALTQVGLYTLNGTDVFDGGIVTCYTE